MSSSFLQFCDKCIYKKTSNEGNAIVEICNNKDSRFYGLTAEQICNCEDAKFSDGDDCEFYKKDEFKKELEEIEEIIKEMMVVFEREAVEDFLRCSIYISNREGKKEFAKYYLEKLKELNMEYM